MATNMPEHTLSRRDDSMSFLDLPYEIRQLIYPGLVAAGRDVYIIFSINTINRDINKTCLPIITACKTTRGEVAKLLYQRHFHLNHPAGAFSIFASRIGQYNTQLLCHVSLYTNERRLEEDLCTLATAHSMQSIQLCVGRSAPSDQRIILPGWEMMLPVFESHPTLCKVCSETEFGLHAWGSFLKVRMVADKVPMDRYEQEIQIEGILERLAEHEKPTKAKNTRT